MEDHYLYRGVSKEMHLKGLGLVAKGTSLIKGIEFGAEYSEMGSGVEMGDSITNGIIAHQTCSTKFPSSGISTSTEFDIAKKYAKHNGQEGVVYKISQKELKTFNIELYIVSEFVKYPNKPEDKEVILRHNLDMKIPLDVISELIWV